MPDKVYLDLKAGGQGISLSLKKIVDFFVGKLGTNMPQPVAVSSSSVPMKLSSRMVGKAYMLYIFGSFLFPTKKETDVSVKYLSLFEDRNSNRPWSWGATTLAHLYYSLGASSRVNGKGLHSWIFEHFPKLPGIPTPNQSRAAEFCTRWSMTKTTSGQTGKAALKMFREDLDSYKLEDVIWDPYLEKREDKHNFKEMASFTVSFTKLFPDVVNLDENDDNDDGRVLGDRGGVSHRENVEVPHNQNEGGRRPGETCECTFLKEANQRLQANIQAKEVVNSIYEKKLNEKVKECETLTTINEKLMEEVVNQKPRPLPVKVTHDIWYAKYIHETERLEMWCLTLKGVIKGGDFQDIEDLTWEELSMQFTKVLTIAQEGPKGEYQDDIILLGRGEYQERIDSRLKKIDHKTNQRQTLFQPFNWFQLDIHDVKRDGNTTFRVAVSYAYLIQMKFLNVKESLCTLMTKKPSYWKSVFSQRLDVAYSDLD
ncbi:hypothetical protein GIB67_032724 [Kingdonia uniflora]|uniref:Aminotransferase-like plant mobile domain-containing protein n=1 Tax=Kingdonia uniflora TaxID=39325 RepID=A0A7J7MWB0_9MAGN|nr:hypothetical protein GIB67_032724 [Kingdonia uniflora]